MTLIRSWQKFRAQPAKGHALFFRYPGSWERLVDAAEQSYPTEKRGRPFFRYPPSLPGHAKWAYLRRTAQPPPPAGKPPGELARHTEITQHKPPALENTTPCLNDILKSAGELPIVQTSENKRK